MGLDFGCDFSVELETLLFQSLDEMKDKRVVVDELEKHLDTIQLMELDAELTRLVWPVPDYKAQL